MPRISLSEARPGQRIARPVANGNGVTLVQAGTVLTASLIERLHGFGVTAVILAGEAGPARTPAEVVAEMDARFAGHEGDPLMMSLRQLMLEQAGVEVAGD